MPLHRHDRPPRLERETTLRLLITARHSRTAYSERIARRRDSTRPLARQFYSMSGHSTKTNERTIVRPADGFFVRSRALISAVSMVASIDGPTGAENARATSSFHRSRRWIAATGLDSAVGNEAEQRDRSTRGRPIRPYISELFSATEWSSC